MGALVSHRLYVTLVLVAAVVAAMVGGTLGGGSWDATSLAVFGISLTLAALTRALPLKVSPQAEASLFGAPVLLAAILLSPVQAALVAGIGSSLADLWLRRSTVILAFNAGVSVLAVSLAGVFFHRFVGPSAGDLLAPSTVAVGLVAGFILQTTNLAAMVGMVSLRKGLSFWVLWQKTWLLDTVQEGGSLLLGYLAAILVHQAWWTILLLVAPLALTHVVLGRSVKEAGRNIKLAEQLKTQMEELRATQEQLIQSAKMASIGTLAAGVAHEINNPLFAMMGRAELLLRHPDRHFRSERARQYVQIIYEQGDRAAGIVRDLLAFSRESTPVEPVRVTDAIDKSVSLLGKATIQVRREYAGDLPLVDAAPARLQQVFLNLLQNARDAMPEGGTVYVRCWAEGDKVIASIRDTGTGMSHQTQEHLFEPFFTTKEVGKGTGLGLFICHRIVTEHGGKIRINSEQGRGTEVLVELPVSQVPATAAESVLAAR